MRNTEKLPKGKIFLIGRTILMMVNTKKVFRNFRQETSMLGLKRLIQRGAYGQKTLMWLNKDARITKRQLKKKRQFLPVTYRETTVLLKT